MNKILHKIDLRLYHDQLQYALESTLYGPLIGADVWYIRVSLLDIPEYRGIYGM